MCLAPLGAQTTAGSIVGTVTDPSGAIVAGATVTITNMGTNIAVKTTSDSSGEYVVTPLEVGKYSVTVEATGFKRSIRPDIQVNVQDRVRVDAKLEVGNSRRTRLRSRRRRRSWKRTPLTSAKSSTASALWICRSTGGSLRAWRC